MAAPDSGAAPPALAGEESLHLALVDACDRLGLDIFAPQGKLLMAYLGLLERWNATYNLTSVRDPRQMLTQHLADCLAVIGPLRRHLGNGRGRRVLDVGSGGGLPGVVIAALEPELEVTCVDTVGKKAAFIRQAGGELGLPNLRVEHARVEQLLARPFDLITARAFASLADLVRLTSTHLAPRGVWMAMKGRMSPEELSGVPETAEVFHVEPLAVPGLDAERCLVWIRARP